MLIGATARDIIMDGIYDLGVSRMTADVDFAVFVPKKQISELLGTGNLHHEDTCLERQGLS